MVLLLLLSFLLLWLLLSVVRDGGGGGGGGGDGVSGVLLLLIRCSLLGGRSTPPIAPHLPLPLLGPPLLAHLLPKLPIDAPNMLRLPTMLRLLFRWQISQRLSFTILRNRSFSHLLLFVLCDCLFVGRTRVVSCGSCNPNCDVQAWNIAGYTRLGIYAKKDLVKGESLSYDYKVSPCACTLAPVDWKISSKPIESCFPSSSPFLPSFLLI